MPAAFVEVTLHTYVFAIVKSDTRIGEVADEPVFGAPPSLDVHVAALVAIAAPLIAPAVNATDAALPTTRVTTRFVALLGTVAGVTALDALDALLGPALFVAVTVNVYAVPLSSPVTVHDNAPDDHKHVRPSGFAVTVYSEIAAPPLLAGAVHDTSTE